MYYLNAFNEMLRKRQRQNMMGGEGYQGVGNAPLSGPMGLGPAQDRSSFRDFYNNMSPGARFGLSMIPGVGKALNIGNLASYAMSQYDKSQLAPANAAMEAARQGFQASEKGLYDAPEYGPAPVGNVFQNAYEAGMVTNSFPAERMGGTVPDDSGERLSVVSKPDIVSDPMSRASLVGTPLAPMDSYVNPGFAGGVEFGGGLGGFGSSSNEGVGIGERGDLARGGLVTPEHLHGPNPPGEDDGYTALKRGEYVITKAAVEKYGKRLLDAINNGTFR
jgi:hypothetical protein